MGMVVRTNTMSANAYRQLGANNTQLSKSLEKLSSGFRINRAGDDAAGLAISEKMKAQIKGLEQASANSQDGISLVQTAEGALTEVHSMLNRMVELATKSANGTVSDNVDRTAIQTEVKALSDEITRISQSTNFNGIKLLDGSLGGTSSTSGTAAAALNMSDALKASQALIVNAATKAKSATTLTGASTSGKTGSYTFTYVDESGATKTSTIKMTADASSVITYSVDGGDTKTATTASTGASVVSAADAGSVLKEALSSDTALGKLFDVTNTGAAVTFTAKDAGATSAKVLVVEQKADINAAATTSVASNNTAGVDKYSSLDTTKMKVYAKTPGANAALSSSADDTVFSVNGQKFAFINASTDKESAKAALGEDVTLVTLASAGAAPVAADATAMTTAINTKLGYDAAAVNGTTTTQIDFKAVAGTSATTGAGLTLQVGDTNDSFNKVTVSVGDMSASGLGIATLDVSSQDAAGKAVATIKAAINTVSTNRGNLGALQNRLEHAISNLDTTAENMDAANSAIRDTDMAKEMMNYTKMNILSQAAQAMLAQANQQPQNILQLLK